MADHDLRPSFLPARTRWLAFALVAGSTVFALGVRSDPAPVTTTFAPQLNIVTQATPAPIAIAPAAPPAANRPSCPPPRTDAPHVAPTFDEDIEGIQAAPTNAGWMAAWNHDHVFVSYDAGATFQRALDGEGRVASASFDCFGHLIALRGNRVGIKDGTQERWHDVRGLRGAAEDPGGVLGGGPDVVVVGVDPGEGWNARAAISSDAGATWAYHDLGNSFETGMHLDGRQHPDGTIDVALSLADCMNDVLEWSTIHDGTVDKVTDGMPEGTTFGIYGDLAVDDYYWRKRGGERHELPDHPEGDPLAVVPGAFPVIVAGDKTFRFDGTRMRALRLVVEGTPQTVDPAGRVWSIACGKPLVAKRTATGAMAACSSGD